MIDLRLWGILTLQGVLQKSEHFWPLGDYLEEQIIEKQKGFKVSPKFAKKVYFALQKITCVHKNKYIALEKESFSLCKCKMSIIGLITNACVNGTMINQALLANTPKALALLFRPMQKPCHSFAHCWPCQTFRTHIHHLIDWEERRNNWYRTPYFMPQLYALIPLMKGRPGWTLKLSKGEKIGVLC